MKILITAPYNESSLNVLKDSFGDITYHSWKSNGKAFEPDELIELLHQTDAEALITEHDKVTKEVIQSFPHLRFIGVCRGTPSNVDIKAASDCHIPVFYTPARNAEAVAEIFIANVITFMRNTLAAMKWLDSESWKAGAHDSYLQFKGNELAGKTIGMVGFGAIGQRIAKMTAPFPCMIKYFDPYVKDSFQNAHAASLEEIFSQCDIVSIHLPANEQTKDMIDDSLLKLMKKESIFVNTSRASVVKRNDLLKILLDKRIKGAILDVFDSEPPDDLDYKLIHLPQVMATPHIAGATHEVEDHHAEIMNKNLLNWYVNHADDKSFVANKNAIIQTT